MLMARSKQSSASALTISLTSLISLSFPRSSAASLVPTLFRRPAVSRLYLHMSTGVNQGIKTSGHLMMSSFCLRAPTQLRVTAVREGNTNTGSKNKRQGMETQERELLSRAILSASPRK